MDITRYGRFMTTDYDLRAGGGFDRILWMIDGHLIDYIGPIEIGLAGIKQIEIIRGPGSALFGNSAFTGTSPGSDGPLTIKPYLPACLSNTPLNGVIPVIPSW
jgi:hypothetical protein